MNCDRVQQDLVEYVLGDLSASENAAIEAHLRRGCDACERELSEVRSEVEAVYAEPAHVELAATEIQRIQDSVKDLVHSRSSSIALAELDEPNHATLRNLALYLGALAAGLLAALLIGPAENWTSKTPGNQLVKSATPAASVPFVQAQPRVVLTSLKNPTALGNPIFRVLYDEMNQELHLYCEDLAPPTRNTHYELFTLDANGAKRSLGTLEVLEEGTAQMVVDGLSKYNVTAMTIEVVEDYSQL